LNVLELRDLVVDYKTQSGKIRAVAGVSLSVPANATLGLVGESGCGKSSLARAIVGLTPAAGQLLLSSLELDLHRHETAKLVRRRVQMVFQDHSSSLNPRMTVFAVLSEALGIHQRSLSRRERQREAERLIDVVTLDVTALRRYPHELSGGQRQRVAVARALAAKPDLLIADEMTSALDVSVQAVVLNLLRDVQAKLGMSCIFISHNLAAVRYMSDIVAVMYMGRIVECAAVTNLFGDPQHPYTRALIASIPGESAAARGRSLGELPDLRRPPKACRYQTRCSEGPLVRDDRSICREIDPQVSARSRRHLASCHFAPPESATSTR
jgi:peptide/nickel transport system ATP-binding protein